jgi:protoporphyrinogen oxidase
MKPVVVLGSGMGGLGAIHRLRENGAASVLYERNAYIGGHTSTHFYEGGWTFDEGPHISFTKNERFKNLLAQNIEGRHETLAVKVNNYWRGHWITHPVQVNLHGLPTKLIAKILEDFIAAYHAPAGPVRNYEDWLRASFGNTFAETFPMEYTVKYHTTTAANLNTDWIGPRLYRANPSEVLLSALEPATRNAHYATEAETRYPREGGFAAYLPGFVRNAEVHVGHEVKAIDPQERKLTFANGKSVGYEHLISSIPLPDLIPMIAGTPPDVLAAAGRLACSEIVIVNLGIDRPDLMDTHWSYFYDRDVCFSRLSTPHMQSARNVPPGCGSLQAECYYSAKYRPLDRKPEDCIDPVIADLRRCGILRDTDKILFRGVMHIPYANVIFDLECNDALAKVHGWLDEIGVAYCGRYGDWKYIWTDESFVSGENAAQRVLDGKVRPRR